MNIENKSKIFIYDKIENRSTETEQEYFQKHWAIIQKTVAAYLIGEGRGNSIVLLKRSLEILLIRHKYCQIYQNLVKLFYTIYKQLLLSLSFQNNCLLSLLAYYTSKKRNYKIIFQILNSYLLTYSPKKQLIEEKAYKILCKQVINSHLSQKIMNELLNIVERFRNATDLNEVIQLECQLRVIASIGIYQYCDHQFLERSKQHFINFSQEVTKTEEIFNIINEAMNRQTSLNKILKPTENTMKYLQKQLIEQYYPFMIEYMDYLIEQNKLDKLRMLWSYSHRLSESERHLLEIRLEEIIKDTANYLKDEGENISKILHFIDLISNIIKQCFDSNRAIINLLHNTIDQVLTENQKKYHQILSKKIFKPSQGYDQEIIYKLFKLLPNKERFIRQFQMRLFRWILNSENNSIHFQEIIHIIKKQCGFTLCKKIDRMINDVWKDGQMIYYKHPTKNFRCRLISSNDCPKFTYENISLPDAMRLYIIQFEQQMKKSPENNYKEITWINELGTVEMAINGITSTFSQHQAAIIFILEKSFRPMKKQQLVEVLQGSSNLIFPIIDELLRNDIITLNQMNETYELNDANQKPYFLVKQQKEHIQEMQAEEKRDDTVIIEAYVVRIMKKKKVLPKTDITKLVYDQITNFKPTLEQINLAIERLVVRDFIDVDKMRGTIRYKE